MEIFPSPSSSSSSASGKFARSHRGREKFLFREILPAIRGRSCPICFEDLKEDHSAAVITNCLHAYCLNCIRRWSELRRACPLCNAEFDSFFSGISLRHGSFREEIVPALPSDKEDVNTQSGPNYLDNRRVIRRSRNQLNSRSCRTRPLQWQRSFGRPDSVPQDVIAARKLQWRASIYTRQLQSVLPSPIRRLEQNISRNNGWKERMLQRVEPWIRRELQAILGDPDPTVIVHLATSLFLRSREENISSSRQLDDINLIAPLHPFLHDRTHMFWHELSCYAESSLAMETYDAVVEYKQLE